MQLRFEFDVVEAWYYAAVFQGCMDSLQDFLREHLIILGAVGIGLCSLQVNSSERLTSFDLFYLSTCTVSTAPGYFVQFFFLEKFIKPTS